MRENVSDEIRDLRRAMRDVVALSTLPAIWTGYGPEDIAQSLADVLLSTLSLDLIYIQLRGHTGGDIIEVAPSRLRPDAVGQVQVIGEALVPWLNTDLSDPPPSIPNPLGSGTLRIASARFGHTGDCGVLVAGSQRPDFPTESDRLLLGLGANQTAIVLQRQRAEEALRESAARYQGLVQASAQIVWTTDASGAVVEDLPSWRAFTGQTHEQSKGWGWLDVFHPEDRERVATLWRRAVAKRTPVQTEYRIRHVSGEWRWTAVRAMPVLNRDGSIREWVGMNIDITEHKRAEEAQARLAAIITSSEDAIIGKTLDSIVTSWNDGAQRIFGYRPEEVIGKSVLLLIPPERRNEESQIIERVKRGEWMDHYETVRRRKDGSQIHVSLSISPIKDARGQIVGVSKIARDITERKRAEEALKDTDKRKDEFLAILAHELRSPLAPIRFALEILRTEGRSEPDLQLASDVIDRQAQQMTRLVEDLLDVSRFAFGKIELRKERVELVEIVRRALETSRPLIEASGHELTVTLPPEPVYLDADLTRLAQVLLNLLNNAAKYTERGGHIWLTAERQANAVVVRVQDTGIGIPADMLPNIFDTFTQADRSLERSQGGLGIGLTLVKRLVELHGGSVEAQSDGPGKGSEFVVRLPVIEKGV